MCVKNSFISQGTTSWLHSECDDYRHRKAGAQKKKETWTETHPEPVTGVLWGLSTFPECLPHPPGVQPSLAHSPLDNGRSGRKVLLLGPHFCLSTEDHVRGSSQWEGVSAPSWREPVLSLLLFSCSGFIALLRWGSKETNSDIDSSPGKGLAVAVSRRESQHQGVTSANQRRLFLHSFPSIPLPPPLVDLRHGPHLSLPKSSTHHFFS